VVGGAPPGAVVVYPLRVDADRLGEGEAYSGRNWCQREPRGADWMGAGGGAGGP
jgi:hypothetical protein